MGIKFKLQNSKDRQDDRNDDVPQRHQQREAHSEDKKPGGIGGFFGKVFKGGRDDDDAPKTQRQQPKSEPQEHSQEKKPNAIGRFFGKIFKGGRDDDAPEGQKIVRGEEHEIREEPRRNLVRDREAENIVKADPNRVIYREYSGNGFISSGQMTFMGDDGKVKVVPAITGGLGRGSIPGTINGTGAVDPRYPRAGVIDEYEITNFRNRSDKGGFSFDLRQDGVDGVPGTGRGAFRIHPDVGAPGRSQGCPCPIHYADALMLKNSILARGGEYEMQLLPTADMNNPLVAHNQRGHSRDRDDDRNHDNQRGRGNQDRGLDPTLMAHFNRNGREGGRG